MTVVVVVGDVPSTGITPGSVAVRVPEASDPTALLSFLDRMSGALAQRGAVLVVHPAWRADAAVKLVRQARMLLATDRIARVALEVPPLALSVVADQLAFVAPYVRPGVLASIAPHLADRLFAGAWLASVAKLERGQARLGQHMLSYLPGSGFMVTSGAVTTVHRITGAKPVHDIARRPVDPVLMLVANVHGDMDWLENRLRPELKAVTVTNVGGPPLGAEYWGTKKYTEFVAFSGHPHDLHHVLQSVRCVPCPWCGEPTALPLCPFCGGAQSRTQTRPRPETPPGPAGQPPAGVPARPDAQPQPETRPVPETQPGPERRFYSEPRPGPVEQPMPAAPAEPVPPRPHPPPGAAPRAFGSTQTPVPPHDRRPPDESPDPPPPASPAHSAPDPDSLVSEEDEPHRSGTVEFRVARHL